MYYSLCLRRVILEKYKGLLTSPEFNVVDKLVFSWMAASLLLTLLSKSTGVFALKLFVLVFLFWFIPGVLVRARISFTLNLISILTIAFLLAQISELTTPAHPVFWLVLLLIGVFLILLAVQNEIKWIGEPITMSLFVHAGLIIVVSVLAPQFLTDILVFLGVLIPSKVLGYVILPVIGLVFFFLKEHMKKRYLSLEAWLILIFSLMKIFIESLISLASTGVIDTFSGIGMLLNGSIFLFVWWREASSKTVL